MTGGLRPPGSRHGARGAAFSTQTGGTMMKRVPMLALVMALGLVLILAMPALADEAKGKVKSLDPDKSMFVITDANAKDLEFHALKDCKVFLNDKDAKLAHLKVGDQLTITYAKEGEKMNASEIRVKRD